MAKLLLLIILAVAIYLVVTGPSRTRRSSGRGSAGTVENMVMCARCGVNVPHSEAIEEDGRFFCSEEHRRLGAA